MTAPSRVVAIMNPVSPGYPKAVQLLRSRTEEAGLPAPVILHTTREDFGGGQADEALALGAELVLVGGGDGTVRAVAERLIGTDVELGIIPLGTANIFARNLGLSPRRLGQAVDVALFGGAHRLDLGSAVFRTAALPTQPTREHLFLVLAGLGNDAETVARTRPGLKRRLGWLAYFESGARHLLASPVSLRVSVDDGPSRSLSVWSYLVGNAGRIPMGIQIFPEARLDDGQLRTMEVWIDHLWQWIPVGWAGLRGNAETSSLVHGRARRLVLEPDKPVALQLDGDVFGPVVGLEVGVHPAAVAFRVPSGTGQRQWRENA